MDESPNLIPQTNTSNEKWLSTMYEEMLLGVNVQTLDLLCSNISLWIFPMPIDDLQLNIIVQQYLDQIYLSWLHIINTDRSKDPVYG